MVTSPNGNGVVLIGGSGKSQNELIEFDGDEWVILDQSLKYKRSAHSVIKVPIDFSCSNKI